MYDIDWILQARKDLERHLDYDRPSEIVKSISDTLSHALEGCNKPRSLDRQVQAILWARDVVMRGGRL